MKSAIAGRAKASLLTAAFAMFALGSASTLAAASTQADFDGDGKTDITVYRPGAGEWYVLTSSSALATYIFAQWGLPGDIPVNGDFDGDGKQDFAVYRRIVPWVNPGQVSEWYVLLSSTGSTTYALTYFGLAGDIPVPADYDGDGKTDIAVYRPTDGTWHVRRSSVSGAASYVIHPNASGSLYSSDYPVPSDYDGDGRADLATYRRTSGTWYFRLSSAGFSTITSAVWGTGTDRPVPGDYDGDGKADLAVYAPSSGAWSIKPSSGAPTIVHSLGEPGDIVAAGDYDGDGKTDLAVHRPANGVWYILSSTSSYAVLTIQQWALSGDVPIPQTVLANAFSRIHRRNQVVRDADFDGDGLSDLAVFRPADGKWHILQSSTTFQSSTTYTWGLEGDIPVASDFDGDGITDVVVWRPTEGKWYFRILPRIAYTFSGSEYPRQFGLNGDIPSPVDVDGNGYSNLNLFRPAGGHVPGWYRIFEDPFNIFCGPRACTATAGDVPVANDYDGDGRADRALYAPSTGTWAISRSFSRTETLVQLGIPGDIAVPADYDGDGAADTAVFRPSTGGWLIRLSSTGYTTTQTYTFGANGDIPVPGDFDGDGLADVAVWRPSTGVWSILKSSTNFTQGVAYQWGLAGDVPILGRQ